jgi:hypothetical protein
MGITRARRAAARSATWEWAESRQGKKDAPPGRGLRRELGAQRNPWPEERAEKGPRLDIEYRGAIHGGAQQDAARAEERVKPEAEQAGWTRQEQGSRCQGHGSREEEDMAEQRAPGQGATRPGRKTEAGSWRELGWQRKLEAE